MRRPREHPEQWLVTVLLGLVGRFFVRQKVSPVPDLEREKVRRQWSKIEELMAQGGESRFIQAVIEADKLLDAVLIAKRLPGHSLAQRLAALRGQLSNKVYQDLWEAHKLRNLITHEVEQELLVFQAKEAIVKFKKAFEELGVI